MPDIRELQYFIAVAEELHFGRAARRLRVSQPPLSRGIRRIERELDRKLFHRHARGVKLTPDGVVFLEGARRVISEMDRTVEATIVRTQQSPPSLRVGFTAYSRAAVLSRIVRSFSAARPDVRIDLIEDSSSGNFTSVKNGKLDVAPVSGSPAWISTSQLITTAVWSEPMFAAVPPSHPLAVRKSIGLGRLAGEAIILFPERLAPGFHSEIMAACREAGFIPCVLRALAGYEPILEAVRDGTGISLVPASVRSMADSGIVFRRLPTIELRATISAICRVEAREAAREFMDAAAKVSQIASRRQPHGRDN